MTEYVDFDHESMERRLAGKRSHDLGFHGFFDGVEEIVKDVPSSFDESEHNAALDFKEESLLVRQVQTKAINVFQLAVSTPVRITDGVDGQTNVTVQNIGSSPVYVGPNAGTARSYTGFPIAANAVLSLDIAGELWVGCASGASSTVAVIVASYGSAS